MANIFTSSIGKKLIMSISGIFLILFLTLHMALNLTSIFSPETFEAVCEFMALPIVTIMVPVLALGFIVHIVYAFILTAGNLKARGGVKRYEVSNKTKTDSWASRNMIYLGVVVLAGLALHLTHFWSKMQLPELTGGHPENPNELIAQTFGSLCMTILYVVWFASIWLHLTHGFWSAFQTLGWNNNKWQVRLKWVGIVIVTVLMAGFAITAVCGYLEANNIINLH